MVTERWDIEKITTQAAHTKIFSINWDASKVLLVIIVIVKYKNNSLALALQHSGYLTTKGCSVVNIVITKLLQGMKFDMCLRDLEQMIATSLNKDINISELIFRIHFR